MLAEAMQNMNTNNKAARLTEDTLVKGGLSETQPSDAVGTSSTHTPPQPTTPHLSSFKSIPIGYVFTIHTMWNKVMKKLSTLEKKAQLIESGVKP